MRGLKPATQPLTGGIMPRTGGIVQSPLQPPPPANAGAALNAATVRNASATNRTNRAIRRCDVMRFDVVSV